MLFKFRLNIFIIAAFFCNISTLQAQEAQQAVDSDSEGIFTPPTPELTQQSKVMMQQVNARINNINTEDLKSILENQPETVLIDVRTPAELNLMGGHIDSPRHQHIVGGWLELQID